MTFRLLLTVTALTVAGLASAKLPPPDDAAKAKAAETGAKAAWQGKVDGFLLCRAQDRVTAAYRKSAGASAAKGADAGKAKAGASAPVAMMAAATPAAAASASAISQGGGTPIAVVAAVSAPPPCSDPGPFAVVSPEQKPLEAAGAHSPPGTAVSPPSGKIPTAEMAPVKPGVTPPPPPPAAAKKS